MDIDRIVYLVLDHGVDGRDKESIVFAAYDQQETNDWFEGNPNKAWYTRTKRIIEIETSYRKVLGKLDGLERLLLDLEQKPNKKSKM